MANLGVTITFDFLFFLVMTPSVLLKFYPIFNLMEAAGSFRTW